MILTKWAHRLSLNLVAFKNTQDLRQSNSLKEEDNSSLEIKAITDHSRGTHTPN